MHDLANRWNRPKNQKCHPEVLRGISGRENRSAFEILRCPQDDSVRELRAAIPTSYLSLFGASGDAGGRF